MSQSQGPDLAPTSDDGEDRLVIEDVTASIKSLDIGGADDLSRYSAAEFTVKLVPVIQEKEHIERVFKRATFGFNDHWPEDHPLYSLPKAVGPSASEFSFAPDELNSSPPPTERVLLAPSPAAPPTDRYYPLAPAEGYKLIQDSRYKRGYVYVSSYDISPENVKAHAKLLGKIADPPNIRPERVNGAFVSSPIPGMIEMVPGVPFSLAFNGDMNRLHTVGCLQTLDSLCNYPDFPEILNKSVKLTKLTWGCKAHGSTPEIQPIYVIPGMKENDRSAKRTAFNEHHHDGSFSLASTVMKGEGQGTFLPAVQANTPTAQAQISTVLQIVHDLCRLIMPKCLSKFESEMAAFHTEFNNIICFGGLGPNGTGLQMNVSALGRILSHYIGLVQGGWHEDIPDDLCFWTLFALLLRVGPDGDPGPFCLARCGLYIREKNVWIVFLVFKGSDLHSGFSPTEDVADHQRWVDENLSAAWNLAGPQNRVGYVNYISTVPSERTGSMNISPPTMFGNFGSSQIHKVKQKNFAMHGHAVLGDQDTYANRMGREILYNFWNSLQLCDLDLNLDIGELLEKISYQDHQSKSAVQLKPISFNPQCKAEVITRYLQLYEWHRREATSFHVRIPRLNTAPNQSTITASDKASVIAVGRIQPSNLAESGPTIPQNSPLPMESLKIQKILGQKIDSGRVFYLVLLQDEVTPRYIAEGSPELVGSTLLIEWLERQTVPNLAKTIPVSSHPLLDQMNSSLESSAITASSIPPTPPIATAEKRPQKPLPKPRKPKSVLANTSGHPNTRSNKRKLSEIANDAEADVPVVIEDQYEVEKILNHRQENGIWMWEVQWKGYDERDWLLSDQLSNCVELLEAYNSSNRIHFGDIQGFSIPIDQSQSLSNTTGKKKKPRVEIVSGGVELAENLSTLVSLLSIGKLDKELQQLETEGRSSMSKDTHQPSNTRSMIDLWGNQLYRNSFLDRILMLLPASSMKSAGLQFQLLQNSVEVLPPLALGMKKMSIIQRSFRYEMCCSLVKVFEWYNHSGPAIACNFIMIYRAHGYAFLKQEAPGFADLVDHIIQYVYRCIVTKFDSVNGMPTKNPNKRSNYANNQQLFPPTFGLVLNDGEVASVPANLYGLQISTSQARVKLPIIVDFQIQHNTEALYSAGIWCLQELWSKEIIIPKLQRIDEVFSGGRTTQFNATLVYQRSLTRGAILHCVAEACGTYGIFASSRMQEFLYSPAIIFEGALSRERKFAPEVLKKKDIILQPLYAWIKEYIAENPELPSKAKHLGELADSQMLELFIGNPRASIKEKSSLDGQANKSDAPLIFKPVSFDRLISKKFQEGGIHVTLLDLILREALNHSRKLKAGDEVLSRLLQGLHATRGSTKRSNPDHTNPIRQNLVSTSLLRTHLPSNKLTSKVGISNLLSWMETGQGYKTIAFLESITRPEGFYSSALEGMIDVFQVIVDRNAAIIAQHPEHRKPQDLPGIIPIDDMLIWGQPNNHLSTMPTKDRIGNHVIKLTLKEKFAPYWKEDLQSAWVNFLGEMVDWQDPSTYDGPRRPWSEVLTLLQEHVVIGFMSGLTPFQLANHLAAMRIVEAPTVKDMANWISRNKKLGAYRGLTNLGFYLDPKNAASVHCAFTCIYHHFDEHLTKEDKEIAFFGPIFMEHILCKVPRWTRRLAEENAEGRLEVLALEAEGLDHLWVSGQNVKDHNAFPVPITISKAMLKKIITEMNKQWVRTLYNSLEFCIFN